MFVGYFKKKVSVLTEVRIRENRNTEWIFEKIDINENHIQRMPIFWVDMSKFYKLGKLKLKGS